MPRLPVTLLDAHAAASYGRVTVVHNDSYAWLPNIIHNIGLYSTGRSLPVHGFEKPYLADNSTVGALSLFPCLVVIIITPFAAREPYNAAEAASFNTVIDAISEDAMEERAPS